MIKKILNRLEKILQVSTSAASVYPSNIYDFHTLSFSQEGEDLILKRIFENKEQGFYVDVGAHHPQRFSNTYLFYLKGWRGINIDAMPDSMKAFEKLRPKDINIESAISEKSEILTYYMFNESALNGFSEHLSSIRNGINSYKLIAQKNIRTQKLSEIFDKYLPEGQEIDFLSIDVEGLDYQVLLSNDWDKYRPKILLVEELATSLETISQQSQTYSLLRKYGYSLFIKTFNTSFYKLV
ncbi:MAG: FkbM family methyltransferase [Pseudanabaena sp. M046S1SP1A06QC]|nr:FkbM family methyltransferase [Pseudanabaena sp. M046S1SP1A06QC]